MGGCGESWKRGGELKIDTNEASGVDRQMVGQ